VRLNGIGDLHGLLRDMEESRDFCTIRGAQKSECDPTSTRRCKAMFAEVPRHHLALDIDGIHLVPGLAVTGDPGAAAQAGKAVDDEECA
jgi:hypothetical protein